MVQIIITRPQCICVPQCIIFVSIQSDGFNITGRYEEPPVGDGAVDEHDAQWSQCSNRSRAWGLAEKSPDLSRRYAQSYANVIIFIEIFCILLYNFGYLSISYVFNFNIIFLFFGNKLKRNPYITLNVINISYFFQLRKATTKRKKRKDETSAQTRLKQRRWR